MLSSLSSLFESIKVFVGATGGIGLFILGYLALKLVKIRFFIALLLVLAVLIAFFVFV